MNLVFRIRGWLFLALYLLGFVAPWGSLWRAPGTRPSTLWLASSTLLARTGRAGLGLEYATVTVTIFALACMVLGAVLRIWGTAYLGSGVTTSRAMHGSQLMAAGPFRSVRNPLYLGSWLFGVGVAFLMPPAGALGFILATGVLIFVLIRGEERFLGSTLGSSYQEYRRVVPRFIPRLRPGAEIASSGVRPRWLQSFMAEALVAAFPVCFAIFAWRYNVGILLRCLLICFGASLILRGFRPSAPR